MPNFPNLYRNINQTYKDTKSNILAISNPISGSFAYATDTKEIGYYDGTSWKWGNLEDADTLDGQHGSYYRNASNINAGTLSTDRFSAYSDLVAENRIGLIEGRIPLTEQLRMFNVQEDFTSTTPSGWSWLTGTGFGEPAFKETRFGTILRTVNTSGLTTKSFFYRTFPSGTTEVYGKFWFSSNSNGIYSGIRIDNGSDSNYAEAYIKHDVTSLPYYKLCLKISGTEYEAGAYRLPVVPDPIFLGIRRSGSSWSSWNVHLYIAGQTKVPIPFGGTQSWTPQRVGFITQWVGVTWNESHIDWIGGNGTW